ncbi:MAG: glycosyltransferase family 4 protein [Opitutales bacterium]
MEDTRGISPVCLIAPEFVGPYRNGGVGTACYWQALLLARAGEDITVLYTGRTNVEMPAYWQGHFLRAHGLKYVDLNEWCAKHAPELDRYALQPDGDEMRQSLKVLEFLKKQPFRTLLFQEFLGHGLRSLQYRAAGLGLENTRCALTAHGPLRWTYQGMRQSFSGARALQIHHMERHSALLCENVTAPSAHMADWMAAHWKHPRERITVVPYAFEPTQTPGAKTCFSGFRDLIFFGRLETRKGLHFFLQALERSTLLQEKVRQITFLGKPETVLGRPADQVIQASLEPHFSNRWEIRSNLDSQQVWELLRTRENCLIVAPSLLDNLPFTVIELFENRRAFLTTRAGGIPEIVGEANAHLLCMPTTRGIQEKLETVFREDRLEVDFSTGFQADQANDRQLSFMRGLQPPIQTAQPGDASASARVHLPRSVCLDETAEANLKDALALSKAKAVLGFVLEDAPGGGDGLLRAPTTCDLETLLLDKEAYAVPVAVADSKDSFGEIAIPAEIVSSLLLRGETVAVAPIVAARTERGTQGGTPKLDLNQVKALGALPAGRRPDLSPLIQVLSQVKAPSSIYHLLAALCPADGAVPLSRELLGARDRLLARKADWGAHKARIAIYGIGEHTRVLLLLCPWLADGLAGFVDRRSGGTFLGKPCWSPECLPAASIDTVIYSSRAAETQMHQRLQHLKLEHVLLYN